MKTNERANPVLPLPGISWRGFTLRVFVVVILPLAALLMAIVIISQSLHHQAMTALVGERNLSAARSTAYVLETALKYQAESLQVAAEMVQAGTPLNSVDPVMRRWQQDFSGGMYVWNQDGVQQTISGAVALDLQGEQADFLKNLSGSEPGTIVYSEQLTPAGTDHYAWVGLALPTGQYLAGAFSAQTVIAPVLADVLESSRSLVAVAGPRGEILYQRGADDPNPDATQQAFAETLAGLSGVTYPNTHHGDRIIVYTPIQPAHWGLVMAETWQESASPSLSFTQLTPLLLVPMLALALAGLWYGARQVIYPLQKLEERAGRLAGGDFAAIGEPVGGIAEIEGVQNELVRMAADLRAAQAALHAYIGSLTSGVEAERLSLARELHDDTLQALIALNQRIQIALRNAQQPSEREALAKLEDMTRDTIANLRRVVRGLRPIYLEDLGLSAALEMLAQESSRHTEVIVNYRTQGSLRRMDNEVELAFYRIAQEALSNALRHAQAGQVSICLEFQDQQARLSIEDDGVGFVLPSRAEQFVQEGHYGLLGMRERAELISAHLEIRSAPKQGTRVQVVRRL